jgi:hypothetical protein
MMLSTLFHVIDFILIFASAVLLAKLVLEAHKISRNCEKSEEACRARIKRLEILLKELDSIQAKTDAVLAKEGLSAP